VFEAVALSCDIAPSHLDVLKEADAPAPAADLRQFFKRLRIADENVKAGTLEYVKGFPEDLPYDIFCTLNIPIFVGWADRLSWELPAEFPRSRKKKIGVDWTVWRHRPHAELWEVVAISLGMSPSSVTFLGQDFDPRSPIGSIPTEFLDRLAIAEAHVGEDLKAIKLVEKNRRKYFSTVRLADFVGWFEAIRPALQPPLPDEFPRPKVVEERQHESVTPPVGKPMTVRERSSLLSIIAALAKDAKLDLSEPWKAAQSIEAMTVRLGARVAARTILNHLKAIPDALERKGADDLDDVGD
jgi:hypothetical protein